MLSGIVALLLGASVIAAVSLKVAPTVVNFPTAPGNVDQTSSSEATTQSTSPTAGPPGKGSLSILLTDPPRIPPGVTGVVVTYSGLAVHGVDGWTTMKSSGVVELLGTVNNGETLSSALVTSGGYDALRLNVSSATIIFNGGSYSAALHGGQLTIRVEGDEHVSDTQAGAVLLDIQPTVVNVGTTASPEFHMWANAKAFPVPTGDVNSDMQREGNKQALSGKTWWDDDQAASRSSLQITGASLSPTSLNLSVKNNGSRDETLRIVIITPENATGGEDNAVPEDAHGSAIFVIMANGSLVRFSPVLGTVTPQVAGENETHTYRGLLGAGYNLTVGSTLTLSYSGEISLGWGTAGQAIAHGSNYRITIVGDGVWASSVVKSS
jgi:hypothetical protein